MIPLTMAAIRPVAATALRYWWVGGLLALGALAGYRTHQRDDARVQLSQEKLARANETLQRQRLADDYKTGLAALKRTHETQTQEKEDAFNSDKAALLAAAGRGAADARSLRDKLAQATARRGAADPVGPAACERDGDRLATLGDLAGEGVEVLEEGRSLLRQRDLEVRRLLDQIRIDRAACSPGS